MYSLKEAGILILCHLVNRPTPFDYHPVRFTQISGHTRLGASILPCRLMISGSNISKKKHAPPFFITSKHYRLSIDRSGSHNCVLTLKWKYEEGYSDVSMSWCIARILEIFQHKLHKRGRRNPHIYTAPMQWNCIQYNLPPFTLLVFNKKGIHRVQSINDNFVYYSRSIYPCMLPAITEIEYQQAKPTEGTHICITIMEYASIYPWYRHLLSRKLHVPAY